MIIRKMEHKDTVAAKNMIKNSPSIATPSIIREIQQHINKSDSVSLVIEEDGNLLGVWCSKDFDEYVSLSFFYVHEDIRGKSIVLKFFKYGYELGVKDKPIIVKTKDTTGFERYFEHLKDDLYVFKGFR